jgi:hypothetical protein
MNRTLLGTEYACSKLGHGQRLGVSSPSEQRSRTISMHLFQTASCLAVTERGSVVCVLSTLVQVHAVLARSFY